MIMLKINDCYVTGAMEQETSYSVCIRNVKTVQEKATMTNYKSIFLETNALLYAILGVLMIIAGVPLVFDSILFVIAGIKFAQAALVKDGKK